MTVATWVITITSGITSAIGIYAMIPSERYAIFLASLAGLAITMLLVAAWSYMFEHTRRRDLKLLLALPPILAIVALVSTWSNATALVGPAAVRMHLKEFAAQYQPAINEAQRRGEGNASIVDAINSEAAAFAADVEGEVKEGRLTGSPGRGAVTITLERVADKLASMSEAVTQAAEDNNTAILAATKAFADLQILAERDDTRPGHVKEATEELRSAIIKIDSVSPARTVAAMLPAIDGISGSLLEPEGAGFAAKQRDAINEHIEPRLESMQQALAELADKSVGETDNLPIYEPITPPEAVLRYGAQFPVQWAIAAALDAAPMVFLFLLILGPYGNRGETAEELRMSIGEAIKVRDALNRLQTEAQ
jgi:hypothetical protein